MPALADLEKDKFNAQGEVKVAGDFAVAGQTDYSATDITALGASTSLADWVSAYHDSQLTYKYVEDWEGTQEKIVYLTHPSLGDGYKCLRLFYIYTTQNSTSVVESVNASVVNWTFNDEVQGTISLTLGTITSPAADATAGTDVCTVTITNTGSGSNTLSLSGTNASLYQLNNTTQAQTGSTLTNVLTTDTVVVETASDFANVTYSHSLTVTLTENNFNQTASQNISTSGTEVVASFANEFSVGFTANNFSDRTYAYRNDAIHPTGGYGEEKSISLWCKFPAYDGATKYVSLVSFIGEDGAGNFINWAIEAFIGSSGVAITQRWVGEATSSTDTLFSGSSVPHETWHHLVVTFEEHATNTSVMTNKAYLNGNTTSSDDNIFKSDLRMLVPESTGAVHKGIAIGGKIYTTVDQTYGSETINTSFSYASSDAFVDEITTYDGTLNTTDVVALYNNGVPPNMDDITLNTAGASLQRWFRFGDGANDSASQIEDVNNTGTFITSSTDYRNQLTMNDGIYYSASGNHKYIEDVNRSVSTGITRGNYNKDTSSDGKGWFPDLESNSGFRSSPNVSWSFWIKCSTIPALYSNFFYEYYDTDEYLSVGMASSNRLSVYSRDGGSSDRNFKTFAIASSAFDGEWHHICITTNTNDVANGVALYLDGSLQSVASSSAAFNVVRDKHTQSIALLGSNFLGPGGTHTIAIDEFSTWKKQLSASEVLSLYNSGSPTDLTQHSASADLQRWFRMGDTTGDGVNIKDSQETSYELASFDSQDNTQNH